MKTQPLKPILTAAAIGLVAVIGLLALGIGLTHSQLIWAAPSIANEVEVAIDDFYFDPSELTVSPGTTVVWYNWGETAHTVTIPGEADSGHIAPEGSFSYTFDTPGTFPYHCSLHPQMQGVIYVVNADEIPIDLAVDAWQDQTVEAGVTIDYHVLFCNYDLFFSAQNVVLTVTLPSASTLIASMMDGTPYPPSSQSGGTLLYNLDVLDADTCTLLDLQVRLPNALPINSEVVLTGRISSHNPDPDPDNNYTEVSETITGANMVIAKGPAEDSPPFVAGGVVTYTLQYFNDSDHVAATSVIVTDELPSGVTFISALKDDWNTVTPIVPAISGRRLTFSLGTVEPGAGGELLIRVQLDPGLASKTELKNTAGVATTSAEASYDDNFAFDVQAVVPTLPDLWVDLVSATDGQIDGYQSYWVNMGNVGPLDAHNVTMTLSIPPTLTDLDISPPPDLLVTRANDHLATWFVGTVPADAWGIEVSVSGLIHAAGQITATASVTSTSAEGDPKDNLASVSDYNAKILMPIIRTPNTALVGPQPVFSGQGQPEATVTLYLSGTVSVPGRVLGTAVVDDYGLWTITPTLPINQPGWYWFTATQQLNGRVSAVTGVGNFVTDTLVMDTNTMVRYAGIRPELPDGERMGGINQPLVWSPGVTYTLGVRLTRCAPNELLSPTLQVRLFNDNGLMVGHRTLEATFVEASTGYVEFEFGTPEEEAFELFVRYYCPVTMLTADRTQQALFHPFGLWNDTKEWVGCWESLGCDKPDPPAPPKLCPGCQPIPRPRPRPRPTDPDGLVYDCSMVRAGASMAQAIITRAWVTITQQTGPGVFTPWNALEFDQVNPQYTGPESVWPDKVSRLGYYSFLVPAGKYRIQVTAPGYVSFNSSILSVAASPITLNVALKRPGDLSECTAPMHRLYLPAVMRRVGGP